MNFKKTLHRCELGAVLSPQLRLFLSVDIVGSTALKQPMNRGTNDSSVSDIKTHWLNFVHGFYTGFPELYDKNLLEIQPEADETDRLLKPHLWKSLGDELVFTVLLKHPSHAHYYLKAFRSSLLDAIENWSVKRNLPISFKGTAWLAGFPVFNAAVPIERADQTTQEEDRFDFVGPLIDIGFRLSKYSSPRKFVISADTAWLISAAGDSGGLQFKYHGEEPLKGACHEKPYPIIWIDCHDSERSFPLDIHKDSNKSRPYTDLTARELQALTAEFLDSVSDIIPKPFFTGPNIPSGFTAPDEFAAKLDAANQEVLKIYVGSFSKEAETPVSSGNQVEADALVSASIVAHSDNPLADQPDPATSPR